MSDEQSDIQPLTPDETRQVISGWNTWIKQPSMAARFFTKLVNAMNGLLSLGLPARVTELEKRLAAIEAASKPADAKPKGKNEKLDNI